MVPFIGGPIYRDVQKTSARLCELAPSSVVSSRNLADVFWTILYREGEDWARLYHGYSGN